MRLNNYFSFCSLLIILTSCNINHQKYVDELNINKGDSKDEIKNKIEDNYNWICEFGKYIIFSSKDEDVSYLITYDNNFLVDNIETYDYIPVTYKNINKIKKGDNFKEVIKKIGLPRSTEIGEKLVFNYIEDYSYPFITYQFNLSFAIDNENNMFYLI